MKKLLKNAWVIASVVILAVGVVIFYIFNDRRKPLYDFVEIKRGDISQEVSVTGRVRAAEAVDLAFEHSGKAARVNFKIGDKINAGQILIVLENADFAAQLSQAKANLAVQQANLEALERGTRPEEIQIAQTAATNAQKSLNDAQTNLINIQNKAGSDLNNLYTGIKDILSDAYIKTDDAVNKQVDDLFINDSSTEPKLTFYTGSQAGSDAEWQRRLSGNELAQLKQEVTALSADQVSLDNALIKAENHLKIIQTFLNALSLAVNESIGLSSTTAANYKYYVNTGRTNVVDAITAINGKKQAIITQKATNQNNIAAAVSSANTAKNSLATAQDQLILKQAGSTPEQISAQKAQTESARANAENAQAQLSKTILISPINGILTKQDIKVGEIVTANAPIISVMSMARFEIEANVPEADIAKVKLGDIASVTLDSYGNNLVFEARVMDIEPAETLIDGIATYKTIFQFARDDERIKSGMTANIDIMTAERENILFVPWRAIRQKNGSYFVMAQKNSNETEERQVQIGLKGSDGNIEIITGLKEGEKITGYYEEK